MRERAGSGRTSTCPSCWTSVASTSTPPSRAVPAVRDDERAGHRRPDGDVVDEEAQDRLFIRDAIVEREQLRHAGRADRDRDLPVLGLGEVGQVVVGEDGQQRVAVEVGIVTQIDHHRGVAERRALHAQPEGERRRRRGDRNVLGKARVLEELRIGPAEPDEPVTGARDRDGVGWAIGTRRVAEGRAELAGLAPPERVDRHGGARPVRNEASKEESWTASPPRRTTRVRASARTEARMSAGARRRVCAEAGRAAMPSTRSDARRRRGIGRWETERADTVRQNDTRPQDRESPRG